MSAKTAATLADLIVRIPTDRPLRVAVDGRTASGKTTYADALRSEIAARGRPVVRSSIDGFHRPRAERYARGRRSPEGYYLDARDLGAIRRLLLDPLGPGGDRVYRTASFDLDADRPIDGPTSTAESDAILIVDGTFLQRPELAPAWDVTVFLDTSDETSLNRGTVRDAAALGGHEAATAIFVERYAPAFKIYSQACAPREMADAVVDNEDFDRQSLLVRADGRLGVLR